MKRTAVVSTRCCQGLSTAARTSPPRPARLRPPNFEAEDPGRRVRGLRARRLVARQELEAVARGRVVVAQKQPGRDLLAEAARRLQAGVAHDAVEGGRGCPSRAPGRAGPRAGSSSPTPSGRPGALRAGRSALRRAASAPADSVALGRNPATRPPIRPFCVTVRMDASAHDRVTAGLDFGFGLAAGRPPSTGGGCAAAAAAQSTAINVTDDTKSRCIRSFFLRRPGVTSCDLIGADGGRTDPNCRSATPAQASPPASKVRSPEDAAPAPARLPRAERPRAGWLCRRREAQGSRSASSRARPPHPR